LKEDSLKEVLTRLKEILVYDQDTGKIYTKRKRLCSPSHDGTIVIFDKDAEVKSKRFKLDRLAYALANNVFPRDDQIVLHKNLDGLDNRPSNMSLVSRETYRKIKEAHRNLSGGISLIPHDLDQFAYVLRWHEGGEEKKKIIYDIVVARRQQLRLQLKYSKILTKYCIFD